MIDVSALHAYTTSFQARGLSVMEKARHKKHKHAGEVRPVNPAQPTAVTTKPKRPVQEFSVDWRDDPQYNPHGLPRDEVIHPDPVNANRMNSFKQAADRLAAHADRRVDEIRKGGK